MEIPFDLSDVFDAEPIQKLDRHALLRLNPRKCWAVKKAIDQMGVLSSQAQGLRRVLTSYEKVLDHDEEQVIYLMWRRDTSKPQSSHVIGLLKVGRKRLWLLDENQQQFEATPLCILDFYIHESKQRQGNGHTLFERMLECEEVEVGKLAIDRPSDSLVQFMRKHYSLQNPIWQSTNFAVYPPFFESMQPLNDPNSWKNMPSDKMRAGGSRPPSAPVVSQAPRSPHRAALRDSAGGVIHGTAELPTRRNPLPDSATGRKNTRDFGHTSIW